MNRLKDSTEPHLTLYLLRHGESVGNVNRVFASRKVDPPLSPLGREQIERQSKALASIKFDACYTSPLLRAVQSSEILNEQSGLQFAQTKTLLEVDVGDLDGKPENVIQNWTIYENSIRKWEEGLCSTPFPGGESLQDIEDRFSNLLKHLKGMNRCLLIGHCLLFMCVVWLYAKNHGPTLESGHMGRGHLSILAETDRGFRLLEFNQAPPSA
jgi:broad specificity phosphatase PhoE